MNKKSKKILNIVFLWGLFFLPMGGSAQTGEGGGVYVEDGGRLIGTVVVGNQAADGFGVAGGGGTLLNCTVVGNESEEGIRKGIRPGDIFCKTGEVMDTSAYQKRGMADAMGVVFWVNSNPFASNPKMYVLALQEEEKKFGANVGSDVDFNDHSTTTPATDTVCYGKMDWLLGKTGDWPAAEYCQGYVVEGQPEQVGWTFPAGYQMLAVYLHRLAINQTLRFLAKQGESAALLSEAVYWTFSLEGGYDKLCVWIMNFKEEEENGLGAPGTINTSGDGAVVSNAYRVRPVFVYGN